MPNDGCFRENRGGRLLITNSLSLAPPVRGGMPTAALGNEKRPRTTTNTGHTRQPPHQRDPFTHSLTHPILTPQNACGSRMPCTQDKGIPCEISPAAVQRHLMMLSMVCIICPTNHIHLKRKTVHPDTSRRHRISSFYSFSSIRQTDRPLCFASLYLVYITAIRGRMNRVR